MHDFQPDVQLAVCRNMLRITCVCNTEAVYQVTCDAFGKLEEVPLPLQCYPTRMFHAGITAVQQYATRRDQHAVDLTSCCVLWSNTAHCSIAPVPS